jgi:hypothetical protein
MELDTGEPELEQELDAAGLELGTGPELGTGEELSNYQDKAGLACSDFLDKALR